MRFRNLSAWAGVAGGAEFVHETNDVLDLDPAVGAARCLAGVMEPADAEATAAVEAARCRAAARAAIADLTAERDAARTAYADAEARAQAAHALAEAHARAWNRAHAALAEKDR